MTEEIPPSPTGQASAAPLGEQDRMPTNLPTPEEQRQILYYGKLTDMTDGFERENQRSRELMENNPINNTGVGDTEFAASQFMATLYATRIRDIDIREGRASDQDDSLKHLIQEGNMWERMSKGEPLAPQETAFVRSRALSIRTGLSHEGQKVFPLDTLSTKLPNSYAQAAASEEKLARLNRVDNNTPANENLPQEAEGIEDPEERLLEQVPDDPLERGRFGRKQFGEFNAENIPLFKAYLRKEIEGWAAQVPEGARYPDSIAGILGNSNAGPAQFLRTIVSGGEGRMVDPSEFKGMRFSEVAGKYLGIDVRKTFPEFDQKFA